jgi:sigma-B regulation protein RsbU (phosphoserine phosphatase)
MQESFSILQTSRLLFHTSDFHASFTHEELYRKLDQALFELLGRSSFTVLLSEKILNHLSVNYSTFSKSETFRWTIGMEDPMVLELLKRFEENKVTLIDSSLIPKKFPLPAAYAVLLENDEILYGFVFIHEGLDQSIHDPFPVKEILTPLFHHFTRAYFDLESRMITEKQFGETTGKLLAINEVAELLGQLDLETLLPKVMSLALHLAGGEVGNLMISRGDSLETKVEWGLKDSDVRGILFKNNTPMVDASFKNRAVFISHDLNKDDRITLKVDNHKVQSIVSVPLYTKTKTLGILNLVNTKEGDTFVSENISTLQTVARLASTAIENAMLHVEAIERKVFEEQLRIARQIWENIMPQNVPVLSSASISARSIPATVVGGDFYDFIQIGEDRLALVIADVSGKGIPAAMMMNTVKSVLHIEATRNPSPYDLVTNVNNLLIQSAKMEGFITLTYLVIDLGLKRLFITNAGHNPTLIFRKADNTCQKIGSESIPLAIMQDQAFPCAETPINPGDAIILYTDGITESRNPQKQMFELDRLSQIIERFGNSKTADEIVENIYQGVKIFSSGASQHDDMTVVGFKFNDSFVDQQLFV